MTCYMPHALPPPRARGRASTRYGCRLDLPPTSETINLWKIYPENPASTPPEVLRLGLRRHSPDHSPRMQQEGC